MLLGYSRVSTAEQATSDRTSLSSQEQVIRGLAMARGYSSFDIAIYQDAGVSGATPLVKRPAGGRLFADAQKGDLVIAAKLDRMFRSALDALKVAEHFKSIGVDLVLFDMGSDPVTADGMAKAFFTMAAAFAELERSRITERMIEGRRGKKQKGGHIGGSAPWGFRVVGTGRDAKLEPVDGEVAVLKVVADLKQQFRGPYHISKALRDRGHVDRAGNAFRVSQVQRLMARA